MLSSFPEGSLGAKVWRRLDRVWKQHPGQGRGEGQLGSNVVQKFRPEERPWTFSGTSSGLCLPSQEPWVQLCPVLPLPHCPPRVLRGTWLAVY